MTDNFQRLVEYLMVIYVIVEIKLERGTDITAVAEVYTFLRTKKHDSLYISMADTKGNTNHPHI